MPYSFAGKIRKLLFACSLLIIALVSFTALPTYANEKYKCPDYSRPKDGDINGDGKKDWNYSRVTDDFGNDVELWGIDPDGKNNTGTAEDPFDEFFAKIFSRTVCGVEEKYFVGKCPWEGGDNNETVYFEKVNVGGVEKKRFVELVHKSVDKGTKDEGLPGEDYYEWTYDAKEHKLTTKHYDKNGHEQTSETKTETPPKWKSPGSFNDIPPYISNFTWYGELMTESPLTYLCYPLAVGGVSVSVYKVDSPTPYIGLVSSTIMVAIVAATICAKRRFKHRKQIIHSK